MLQIDLTQSIDWSRLAEPQADQYDTEIALRLATTTVGPERPQFYQRMPVGSAPAVFDGQVAVRHVYRTLPEFGPLLGQYPDAPADHPNIALAAEHVRCWPAAFAQCQRLLEAIHPALDPQMPLVSSEIYRGSSCHSFERLFGTMWATIFCPLGLAEAMVHEMAHQKLRVLGVSFESATTVVGNDPTDLYVSPIIKDRLRPMTAVLHAEYSYVHVTALDIHLLRAERDPARRAVLREVLARNLARIEEGIDCIRTHFRPGEHGRAFMEGFYDWTARTVRAGHELLAADDAAAARAISLEPAKPAPPQEPEAAAAAPASTAAAMPAPVPDIDTCANTVATPDRLIDVLVALDSPRVVLLGNVLNDEECDALIDYCTPRFNRSSVVGDAEGNVHVYASRTSSDVGLRRGENALIARIEARLEALLQWPADCCEGLQVVRYGVADEYRPHFDWIDPDVPGLSQHLAVGGQRLATLILYLNDVAAGGATSFPATGLSVMPRKGNALFFRNTDVQGVPEQRSLHAGDPVLKGVKFIANKWLRERTFPN